MTAGRNAIGLSPAWRARPAALAALTVLTAVLGGALLGGSAWGAPVRDLTALPAELQKYLPGTAAWATSAWMTSPACAGRGGDFSVWTASVLADAPALLEFFQASKYGTETPAGDRPRGQAILTGYRAIAADLTGGIPAGYCADELRRWASDPAVKPFGFGWGVTAGDGRQTPYVCTDRGPDTTSATEANRYVGAERAPCDGFYVRCDHAPAAEQLRCQAWNDFSEQYVLRVQRMRGQVIDDHPATGGADTDTDIAGPEDLANAAARSWFANITLMLATGATAMMAEAMTWGTRTDRGEMLESPAITEIQALLRYVGFALLAGGVIWQGVMMMIRRKADPLVTTATGLVSFVAWSTLGGTAAVLMNEAGVALSNHVLNSSIDGFAHRMGAAMQYNVAGNVALVFNLSIILFFLSCVQWALGFFRMGALVILLALIPTAAAGQLTERTKPWLPKIGGWCLALILHQPSEAIIYSIGFHMMGSGNDVGTVLVGMAVLVLAVVAMPALLRFFDWGGQRLVTGGGGGGPMAVSAAASVLGGAGGFGRFMDSNGPAGALGRSDGPGGSGSSGAAPVTSAHFGDGPRAGTHGAQPTGSGAGAGGGAASSGGVSSAVGAGASGAASSASGMGGGAAVGGGAAAGAGAAAGGVGAAAGAAVGGPVGAAVVMGAQAAAAGIGKAAGAAAGAMTGGAGEG